MRDYPAGAVWPAEDTESEQLREVYARFGLAMSVVQILEHGMVNAVLTLTLLPRMSEFASRADWEDAFDSAFEREFAKTFGNVIRSLEVIPDMPPDLIARLRLAKEPRDILAHRFYRLHDESILHPDGRTRMIAWCEDQIELFEALDNELTEVTRPIREQKGMTDDWLEKRFTEDLARFGLSP